MSLPVRLIFGNNNLSLPVEAEEITMAVHRKLHALPIPVTNEKVGIDANMPQMRMNLSLILQDDTVANTAGDSKLKNIVSFTEYPSSDSSLVRRNYTFPDNMRMVFASSYSAGASSVTINVFNTERLRDLFYATKIYNHEGNQLLGDKTGIPNVVKRSTGSWSITINLTGAGLNQNVSAFQQVYTEINPMVGREIELPVLGTRDISFSSTSTFGNIGFRLQKGHSKNIIKLVTTATVSSKAGGSGNPTVRSGSSLIENGDVIIDVPVGGIFTSPDNDNPASTLALVIKDALELTTNITNLSAGIDGKGGKRVVDVFDVQVALENDEVLLIEQKYHLPDFTYNHAFLGTDANPSLASVFTITSNSTVAQMMTAGDKAQTLIGLLANAKSSSTDLLRGIQIPYESLIQSDTISPEVRNFFTTYGRNLSATVKSSTGNTKPASDTMTAFSDRTDGGMVLAGALHEVCLIDEPQPTLAESLVNRATDALNWSLDELGISTFLDVVEELAASLAEAVGAVGSEDTSPGGIRILPEHFHLRKEAAKNYYTVDLDLIMVHKVAGV